MTKLVFICLYEDWNLLKQNYPDLETLDAELPDWEKELIDSRSEIIAKQPKRLKPIKLLLGQLKLNN